MDVLKSIPQILSGYIGPNKIDPETAEKCMLAVNSVNECSFCTSLHGELGRMAGLGDAAWKSINEAKSGADIKKISGNDPMVIFARKFGECDGRGADLDKAFLVLEEAVGLASARCTRLP